ncbi:MAG TPA: hypothetical protein VM033_02765 [Gemmatimonadaceae bacterium]|nr:hypothetical protein [Gemmatimonadaceae bacterium]
MSVRTVHATGQAGDAGDAPAFAAALGALGLPCRVESRARLAVVMAGPSHAARLTDPALRREVFALAKRHGFTHVAIELSAHAADTGAPLLRD